MPIHHQLGEVPRKRHVALRKKDGAIHDFEPRVGRIHLPPPVHQTSEGEESIGAKGTSGLAEMVDTFRPLLVSREALSLEDEGYALFWLGGTEGQR